jgi:hypothetical protein
MMLGPKSKMKNWARETLVMEIKSDGARRQKPGFDPAPKPFAQETSSNPRNHKLGTSRQHRQEVTREMKSQLKT